MSVDRVENFSCRGIVEVMPQLRYILPITAGALLLLLIVLTLSSGVTKQVKENTGSSRLMPNLQPKTQRLLDTSGFSTTAYIRPLESNAEGSIYSSRVQLRGTVDSWKNGAVRIKIGEEARDVQMPVVVRLYCTPPYFLDKDSNRVPAADVALDFSKFPEAGVPFSSDTLPRKISKGKDITVLASVGDEDVMTAYLVVGYGCKE